jgi:hypothetical protein
LLNRNSRFLLLLEGGIDRIDPLQALLNHRENLLFQEDDFIFPIGIPTKVRRSTNPRRCRRIYCSELIVDLSSRHGFSSGLQNGEAAEVTVAAAPPAESVAMVIGASIGAATGPFPAEARRRDNDTCLATIGFP